VQEIHDFHTFGEAMLRQLITEIAASNDKLLFAVGR
jgi:hypothetical protein